MKIATSVTFLALVLLAKAQDANPHIDTPPAVQQCAPAQLTFGGGQPPYDIAALPQGQISAPPLTEIGSNIQGAAFTWKVNVQQNTGITLRIRDANGATAFSGPITIQANTDSSCLNGGASSGASSGSSAPPPPSSSGPGSTSSSGSSSTPAPAPRPSSPSGGASSNRPTTSGGSSSGSASSTGSSSAAGSSQTPGDSAATSLRVGAATGLIGLLTAVVLA